MRRALLVGIDDYSPVPLAGCVSDATELAKLLERNSDGSANFGCRLLTSPRDTITLNKLTGNINDLFSSPADLVIFYFAGHGYHSTVDGFLVTQDSSGHNSGYPMSHLISLANINEKIREVIIILDCCFSGEMGNFKCFNGMSIMREGISIITASRNSESAQEDPKSNHGIFTSLLLEALNGGACDVLGNVNCASIYAYVEQALGSWNQRPLFKCHVSSLSPLRKKTCEERLPLLRRIPEYFKGPETHLRLKAQFASETKSKGSEIYEDLILLRNWGLVEPVGEDHLYYATVHSKSCKLTPVGKHIWRLAKNNQI